ncbi:MAG: transposase [Methylocella sp.]
MYHSLRPEWTLRPVVDALQATRGIALINAVAPVTEAGDFKRFSNPHQLMAYFGMVMGERSSGETTRCGSITKSANTHARRAPVEGVWLTERRRASALARPTGSRRCQKTLAKDRQRRHCRYLVDRPHGSIRAKGGVTIT